jgi:hypothetical protein
MPLRIYIFAVSFCLCATAAKASAADYGMEGFDLVISDTGASPEGWDVSPTRVYAEVAGEPLYFTGMAGAFFALRERFGERVHIDRLLVADYVERNYGEMLDARVAWYCWDGERLAPGGLPLILAFPTKTEARAMANRHDGEVLDFKELTQRLGRWCKRAKPAACWRGDSAWDNARWTDAWNERWRGWAFDWERGWCDMHAPGQPWPHGRIHDDYRWRHGGPVTVGTPHDWHDGHDRARQREREERQRAERERREREERERREREERERQRQPQPTDRSIQDPQPPPKADPAPPPKVKPKQQEDKAQPAPAPKPEKKEDKAQPAPKPEKKDDKAQPAPPPPTKGTNDPKK